MSLENLKSDQKISSKETSDPKNYKTVNYLPTAIRILKKPKDVTSLLGATAVFEVGVSEDDIPVKWMFNNKDLKANEHYKMLSEKKTHKLIVQDVDNSREGEYTVVVGHLQCSARLIVECKWQHGGTHTPTLKMGSV